AIARDRGVDDGYDAEATPNTTAICARIASGVVGDEAIFYASVSIQHIHTRAAAEGLSIVRDRHALERCVRYGDDTATSISDDRAAVHHYCSERAKNASAGAEGLVRLTCSKPADVAIAEHQ